MLVDAALVISLLRRVERLETDLAKARERSRTKAPFLAVPTAEGDADGYYFVDLYLPDPKANNPAEDLTAERLISTSARFATGVHAIHVGEVDSSVREIEIDKPYWADVLPLPATDGKLLVRLLSAGGGGGTLPVGEYDGMDYGMVSDNQSGFRFPTFHAIVGD